MAIKPPSDLVLDVARAADPLEYQASIEKLRNAQNAVRGTNNKLNVNDFASLTDSGASTASDVNAASETREIASSINHPINQLSFKLKGPVTKEAAAYKKFEAFMLQTFIEDMFTTETPSVFGEGLAGKYWKSMMAEQMANEMAEGNGIGIAKMLEDAKLRKEASENSTLSINAEQSVKNVLAVDGTNKQANIDTLLNKNGINLIRHFKYQTT